MEHMATTSVQSNNPHRSSFRYTAPEPFRPARFAANSHVQTVLPFFLPPPPSPANSILHVVDLPGEDDKIVLHDDSSENWEPGRRIVLLVHGLGGCYQSPYMVRMARRLIKIGFRSFRMDMRGCGAGQELAKGVFHAARYFDLLAALQYLSQACPNSPITVCGYSLGANLLLKLLVSAPNAIPHAVDSSIAIGPPIDLQACCRHLQRGLPRHYDRFFVKRLWREFRQGQANIAGAEGIRTAVRPKTLEAFDDLVTAPLAGFGSARTYYQSASAGKNFEAIRIPTAILAAKDDPIVPRAIFEDLHIGERVQMYLTEFGGHLGFLSMPSGSGGHRWLDEQLIRWILQTDAFQGDSATC